LHEFAFTTSVVESLLDLARQQNIMRVLEVHLRIGKLRALSTEQVRFAYTVLTKGTILEGSKLSIENADGLLRCVDCSYHVKFDPEDDPAYHFAIPRLFCPRCSGAMTIEGGDESLITKVRLQVAPLKKTESSTNT